MPITPYLDEFDADPVVPDVHAEGEVRLGFHGQVRLDLSWRYLYPMLVRRVAFPDFCEPSIKQPPPSWRIIKNRLQKSSAQRT